MGEGRQVQGTQSEPQAGQFSAMQSSPEGELGPRPSCESRRERRGGQQLRVGQFGSFWQVVPRCLVLGPGVMKAEEYCLPG